MGWQSPSSFWFFFFPFPQNSIHDDIYIFIYTYPYYIQIYIVKMPQLPPGLDTLSTHTFGHCTIFLSDLKTRGFQINKFMPIFMGQTTHSSFSLNEKATYKIVTNLWHFYSYLSDMMHLGIQMSDSSGQIFTSSYNYRLKGKKQILKPEIISDDLIQNTPEKVIVYNNVGESIGSMVVNIEMEFDFSIHAEVSNLINFQQLLIFEGISPIQSENQLPRQPPKSIVFEGTFQPKKQEEKKLHQVFENVGYSEIKSASPNKHLSIDEQSKIIEDDIDKLVAEMISKPYDSSRYQENPSIQTKKMPEKGNTAIDFYPSQEPMMKPYQSATNLTSAMARPPINRKFSREKSREKSQKKSENRSLQKRSMNQTQKNSFINLKISQLLSTRQCPNQDGNYSVKVYINNDEDEYFSAQGIKEGENTIFNQSIKLKNINSIRFLRFLIVDDYGENYGEGIFNLTRLYTVPSQKGIFTVNIMNQPINEMPNSIKVSTNRLKQVNFPVYRSLRLEAELSEKVQFVQIYIKLSEFSIPFSLVRYKIPFTKQTIEFKDYEHFNVFPHNQSSDKIIVEIWKNQKIFGITEISLKQIKSANSAIINASLEPIYLHDGLAQIKDMFDGRKVGNFNLLLCYGNIKQIHGLLNGLSQTVGKKKKEKQKIEVAIDEKLGVLVKEKKEKVEVEVQVEIKDEEKYEEEVHNQSMTSTNEFLHHNDFHSLSPKSSKVSDLEEFNERKFSPEKKPISLISLSEKICEKLEKIMHPLVEMLPKIKEKCRSHLLFNFINMEKLAAILKELGLNQQGINDLFRDILRPQTTTDMININIIYDFCTSLQINGHLKPSLLPDALLVRGSMKLLYGNEEKRDQLLLQPDMEFKEMKQIYEKIQIKLNLHEFETISKFLDKMSLKECKEMKLQMIEEINTQIGKKMKKGLYEEDIIYQLYGNQQFSEKSVNIENESFVSSEVPLEQPEFNTTVKPIQSTQIIQSQTGFFSTQKSQQKLEKVEKISPKKRVTHKLFVEGLANVRQSSQCLLDVTMDKAYLRVIIDQPTFEQIVFYQDEQKEVEFDKKVEEAEGRLELCNSGSVVACAPFLLIEGIKSVYAMKTKQNEFCGLLSIQLI